MSDAAHESIHTPLEIEAVPIVELNEHTDDSSRDAAKKPSNADLLALVDRFPAPQQWYDE